MPSVSKKQHNLMALVANNPKAAKRLGIPKSVGEDFMKADKGKKFAKGGMSKHEDVKMDKKVVKKAIGMHDKQMHGGKKTSLEGLKKGGKVKKMFGGGVAAPKGGMAAGMKKLAAGPKTFGEAAKAVALRGGSLSGGPKTFPGQKAPTKIGGMGMKEGGMCGAKKYARGGGIEKKGKTKGKVI